jgi:hypothetical protein
MEKIVEDRNCFTAATGAGRIKQRLFPKSNRRNSLEQEDQLQKLFSEGQN